MSAELTRVEQWIYETLSGDATLSGEVNGFFSEVATGDPDYPIVLWSLLTRLDVQGVGSARIMIRADYLVRAVQDFSSGGSYTPIETAADRIDALLHGADGTADDGTIFSCTRREPFSLVETDQGVQYRYLGGLYRIQAQV